MSTNKTKVTAVPEKQEIFIEREFDYDTPVFDRLCPLTYFDTDSLSRINSIWNKVGTTYDGRYPDICSGDYKGKDK